MNIDDTPVRRIAMLSVHTCPLATLGGKKTGGMNVYVRDLSRDLGRRGVQVDVFTRSQDDCQPRIKHDLGDGARVIHVPAGPEKPVPLIEVGNYLEEFTEGVLEFARKEGVTYDLIHSHYWLSGLVAEQLRQAWVLESEEATGRPGNSVTREGSDVARWRCAIGEMRPVAGIPIVHMFHTLGHMKNRVAQSKAERVPQSRIDGEHHVIHVANRIIAATPAEQAQLKWLYGADLSRVVVIPPGVDLDRFRPIPKAEAKQRIGVPGHHQNILFAGRIEPLKGIDTLLQAISLIQKCIPEAVENVCVAIIGGDPWSDDPEPEMVRLQEMRAELDIGDMVTFLGAKDQDALPDYYAAAEMVIVPSHYESFGLVALEAMAMGTPVIASEVGGLAFLIKDGETGFHVPSRDPEALAERIYQLLSDASCRDYLGHQARLYAQRYDWSIIGRRMLAVYQEVINAESDVEAAGPLLPGT